MKRIVLHTNWDHSRELRFLQRLQRLQHPHLIKIIGSFRSGNDHFFLFPWANGGDLQSWWKGERNSEKRTPEMIHWVLKQMTGIASAVSEIHFPREMAAEDESGCHGGLKPSKCRCIHRRAGREPPRHLTYHRRWISPFLQQSNFQMGGIIRTRRKFDRIRATIFQARP